MARTKVGAYTRVVGGKVQNVRSYFRVFDPSALRASQGRPPVVAKPGLMPLERSSPNSWPAQQSSRLVAGMRRNAASVVSDVQAADPRTYRAASNSVRGDKNLVDGMSPDESMLVMKAKMDGFKGTHQEAVDSLRKMVGPGGTPKRGSGGRGAQGAPPKKMAWQYRELPNALPLSDRATGAHVRHPRLGDGEVQGFDKQGNTYRVKFTNDPKTYTIPRAQLQQIEEVAEWEDIGKINPSGDNVGRIVRDKDGMSGKIVRNAVATNSYMADMEDGSKRMVWGNDLTEIGPKKAEREGPPKGKPAKEASPFQVHSRNIFLRANLTSGQKDLAKNMFLTKSSDDMTDEEREFMKEALGPFWQKVQSKLLGDYPSTFRRAREAQSDNGLSYDMRDRAAAGLAMDPADLANPMNADLRRLVEKAYGPDWEALREELEIAPAGRMRARGARQILETNLQKRRLALTGDAALDSATQRKKADIQVKRMQSIFGEDSVHVEDLDNEIIVSRVTQLEHMDDATLRTINDFWAQERRKRRDPNFGGIYIGDKPLTELDDVAAHTDPAQKDMWDTSAGVHLLDNGAVSIGTGDSTSGSVALHEMSHALDFAIGEYSTKDNDFLDAQQEIMDIIGDYMDEYFSNPDEMFAEGMMGYLLGTGQGLSGEELFVFMAGFLTHERGEREQLALAGEKLHDMIAMVYEASKKGKG